MVSAGDLVARVELLGTLGEAPFGHVAFEVASSPGPVSLYFVTNDSGMSQASLPFGHYVIHTSDPEEAVKASPDENPIPAWILTTNV